MITCNMLVGRILEDTVNGNFFKVETYWIGDAQTIEALHKDFISKYGYLVKMEVPEDEIYKHLGL